MASPLEKARKYPESVQAKILLASRRTTLVHLFPGTTTSITAREPVLDISALQCQRSAKKDLDKTDGRNIKHDLFLNFITSGKTIHGVPLPDHPKISINYLNDCFIAHPHIANFIISRYFDDKSKVNGLNFQVPDLLMTLPVRYAS